MQVCYNTLLVIFLSVAFSISTQAQNQQKIDSMINVLKISNDDTNKVKTLNFLSRQLWQIGENEKAKKYADEQLQLAEKTNFRRGKSMAYTNIGIIYENQGNYSAALKCFFEVIKISKEIGSKTGMANGYLECGNIYYLQGNFPDALENYLNALKLNQEAGEKSGVASGYIGIGVIYTQQQKYADALKSYKSALKIEEELGDNQGIAYCYGNMGLVNYYQHNYTEALKNYFALLKILGESGDKKGILNAYTNIGLVYQAQNNFPEALKTNFASLKIAEDIGDKEGIVLSYINIGNINVKLKKTAEAKKYLDDALVLSKEVGSKENTMKSYEGLEKLDSTIGDYKQGLAHYKLYTIYKDSMFDETNSRQIEEMKSKYESEEKEKEIALLTKDKEIQNIEIKKQTLLKNSFICGLALVLVLFFFIYKNYSTKQKLKLENIRNNIAADLHDDIGSTLNSISLFSEVAKHEAGRSIPALEQIGVSARKIIDAMSDIVWTINPENDTFENVIARMRSLSYLLLKAKGIEFVFKADESLNSLSLPMLVRKNIYLLFKEATNNIVKYSNADRASFHITLDNKNVKMVIRDNGVGFDMENAKMGNGIKNMKRRAAEIGAQFLIESAAGNGTNIELNFKT